MSKLDNILRNKARLLETFKARGRTGPSGASDAAAGGRERLPPGQHAVQNFPVLDLGIHPPFDPAAWRLTVEGAVEQPFTLSWEAFRALPRVEQVSDFHCVTTWSRHGLRWSGVPWRAIVERAGPGPAARCGIQSSADGYTTNLPLAALAGDDVLLADTLEGQPLPLEHGGPLRLLVPHLYGWKSAKFLTGLRFQEQDTPGFWEVRGYHDVGDPWAEERFR
jgi:DMSO/TMAO reductase YedYZ molybdopterin-dependent catalytic subunit